MSSPIDKTSPVLKRRVQSMLDSFLHSEASGGLVLMAAAAAAMGVANSPWAEGYFHALHIDVGPLSLLHWINDALMAVFFLMVGLEIKREMLTGQLSDWPRRALPGIAALGGVIVPAGIYVLINRQNPETLHGWAIPTATDIAFALGVLALLGSRVPVALKIFLTALAIIDDLAAVLVIAVFYTQNLSVLWLAAAGACVAALMILNRLRVRWVMAYLLVGVLMWVFVLQSGIHATLAGVVTALFIPLHTHKAGNDDHYSPLVRLEHALHKPVAFLIVPVFGFANAGVSLAGFRPDMLLQPIPLGIALALFFGKQMGVFAASWLAIKSGLAKMPANTNWAQLYAVSVLTGIGFTMSLFIGLLAFPTAPEAQDAVKIGVLVGSLCSGLAGYALMAVMAKPKDATQPD
ncbi:MULTISPECIES: Na+/H+ antiporter NhaA [Asticcacaulis]|uniref:Na+/H+ antiporter NhaA n=1 Tax=Asticcacaulis TaxID=76890 RepID=UPI001AE3B76B|nr:MULTISPECIES: Na+/H+ antiporter NhaA [Asticcacaulis]MBP2160459.1 NhaA family Na+:H+ antiporter [Asticcacaulis solisilvae]MDR6801504.1 NhaA family Na+:H+ antiporter [Asticcacaulis sp. BE141]